MHYPEFTSENKVSDFVNKHPDLAIGIFNKLDIDFCCGGDKPLKMACEEKGLNSAQIIDQLNNAPLASHEKHPADDWTQLNLSGLIEHIVAVHHQYLRDALPLLSETMEKVISAHGKNHPELVELENSIRLLREDLEPHMMKEENILFPRIKSLEESLSHAKFDSTLVVNATGVMIQEHHHVARILEKIKKETRNYSPPEDACETFKHLYKELRKLEADLNLHVHKENNLLFPQALSQATAN